MRTDEQNKLHEQRGNTLVREELGAKVRRLQHSVEEIRGEIHLDGVTVRTDANGRLTELTVGQDAWGRGPAAVADLIMRAYRQTADEVQHRTTSIMAELRDDPVVARIADATIGVAHVQEPPVAVRRSAPPGEQRDVPSAAGQQVHQAHEDDLSFVDTVEDGYFQRKSWME